MLFNISTNKWDGQILKILKIPKEILPVVKDCAADFGYTDPSITGTSYPITGMVGDQQSATIGQCCFEPGSVKSTYGTGAFLLLNTGSKKVYSKNRLLTTICYRINGKTTYALEGTIFIAGAGVQWLRDKIKFIKKASDTEKIAKSLSSNQGIYLVPAFTGLGAPYWNVNARGILTGLTRDTGPKEITRATVESVAYQTYDLFEAMKNDGLKPKLIKVDGGMVLNNWFSQFLSDTINTKVLRPKVNETTALGAAFMAGLQIGVYKSLKDTCQPCQDHPSFARSTLYHLLYCGCWRPARSQYLSRHPDVEADYHSGIALIWVLPQGEGGKWIALAIKYHRLMGSGSQRSNAKALICQYLTGLLSP